MPNLPRERDPAPSADELALYLLNEGAHYHTLRRYGMDVHACRSSRETVLAKVTTMVRHHADRFALRFDTTPADSSTIESAARQILEYHVGRHVEEAAPLPWGVRCPDGRIARFFTEYDAFVWLSHVVTPASVYDATRTGGYAFVPPALRS